MCGREFRRHFAVDLISYTYRDLIQISQNVNYRKCNVCCSLQTASVFGSHTVKPSHTSRTSCRCTEFAAVSAASSQFICLFSEDLAYKCTCSDRAGVCLTYCYDLLDLIWRNTCADRTISRKCGRRSNHRINAMIRILQCSKLSLQQDLFALFDRLIKISGNITYIRFYHLSVAY